MLLLTTNIAPRCWTFSSSYFVAKQKLIREDADEEEVRIAGAVEIQRVWRGYYARLVPKLQPYGYLLKTGSLHNAVWAIWLAKQSWYMNH